MTESNQNRYVLLFLGILTFVICSWVHSVLLQGVPHVVDESSYLLQASIFADNQRTATAMPLPELFGLPFWNAEPKAYSAFPFGWPLLLSIGARLGLAGFINPLCAAFLPWLTYRIVLPLRSRREALIAATIIAFSPGIWVLGGSFMPHTSCLLACLGLWVALRDNRIWWAIVCFAYLLWARPFEGVVLGLPITLWALRGKLKQSLRLWIGYGTAVAFILIDNYLLTDNIATFPMNAWFNKLADQGFFPVGCNSLGFGKNIGCIPTLGTMGHSPEKAIKLAVESLLRLDRLLLGVPGGSLLIGLGIYRWRQGWTYALALLFPIGCYALYWSPGSAYGARFYHSMYLFLPLLTAVAIDKLPRYWPYLLVIGCSIGGGSSIAKDLHNDYLCVSGELVKKIREIPRQGTIFLDITDTYHTSWPAIGTVQHQCSPSQIIIAAAAENSNTLLIRQLPQDQNRISIAPKPHYILRQELNSPIEFITIPEAD